MPPLVDVRNVTVDYRLKAGGVHTVFKELSLTIQQGEFVCVVGETGCGKSTLLKLLLGSEHPTRGTILINGTPVLQPDRDRGYVPQKYSLFPDKTVLQNIAFGPISEASRPFCFLRPQWWRQRKQVYADALQYMRHVGLSDRDARKYPDQISGGMQQRVAIAQSLMLKPKILLMDESFSALDPNTRRAMQRLLRSIWAENKTTIVFVTHNLSEAVYLGTRVLQITQNGKLNCSEVSLDLLVPDYVRDAKGNPRQDEIDRIIREIDLPVAEPATPSEMVEVAS
ncbi:MAG TPA: ATP-binding cassette domain-containing protein [Bryobacteraceae bacterium]|jgi:NitT/TauT family transport system ATP-binding protein|nr:ATP-binding cassette domain-containing protein [Bryobacteraceae bacterium]